MMKLEGQSDGGDSDEEEKMDTEKLKGGSVKKIMFMRKDNNQVVRDYRSQEKEHAFDEEEEIQKEELAQSIPYDQV